MECSEELLALFSQAHAGTLEIISLCWMRLSSGSWTSLFHRIRSTCKVLNLQESRRIDLKRGTLMRTTTKSLDIWLERLRKTVFSIDFLLTRLVQVRRSHRIGSFGWILITVQWRHDNRKKSSRADYSTAIALSFSRAWDFSQDATHLHVEITKDLRPLCLQDEHSQTTSSVNSAFE